ncbi:flavodoxin domain-containing protein [Blattabacterium cuenoti]|uniref:sulfite reductase flavoprotein subunit alpha n=1 Tax=Blattabacterium cuenoti TaxID=1653831 RepID=UPI00163CA0AA|nr:sulfite reductase flavoprotein subunit alpha [Blattabacterium cuenoti]
MYKKVNKIIGKIYKNIFLNDYNKNIENNYSIHHIEISLPYNNNISYSPGDSIGIFPENNVNEVNYIINVLIKKNLLSNEKKDKIFFLLKDELDIYRLSKDFLKKYSSFFEKSLQIDFEKSWNFIELLKKSNSIINCKEFSLKNLIKLMNPIKPRLYSISSSSIVHVNKIHITVSLHHFHSNEKIKYGHCSYFLYKRKINDKLSFFIHENKFFDLPNNNEDIILICSGTGIAPFRSFLYEREAKHSTGKNWLFFGCRHSISDFILYRNEICNWKKIGILTNVNITFSRDQEKKIYVQDEIWKNRIEFYSWIKNGSYVYICGKKNPMSIDVENTIKKIISKLGKSNPLSFIKNMKRKRRFLKEVY